MQLMTSYWNNLFQNKKGTNLVTTTDFKMRGLSGEHESEDDAFGWEEKAFTRNDEVILAEYLLLFITLLCIALVLQFFVGKIWKFKLLTESGSVVLLGMLLGGLIRLGGGDTSDGGMLQVARRVFAYSFLNVQFNAF